MQEQLPRVSRYAFFVEARRTVAGVEVQRPFHRSYVGGFDGGKEWAYSNPQDVLGEMTPAADLLPFSLIQSVFEKMILIVDNQTEAEAWNKEGMPRLTKDYYISSIRLGLSSVAESSDVNTRLLIPVWTFYGYEEARVNDGEPERFGTNGQHALLTINAIDGTVVG